MYQQSHQQSNLNKLTQENSFAKKYLPQSMSMMSDQESSLLCTPQNYMLMISYSTSLEKQNQTLRKQLQTAKKLLKEMKNNNLTRQSFENKLKMTQRSMTQRNFHEATFQNAKLHVTQSNQHIFNQETMKNDGLSQYVNEEIIQFLKEENQRLFLQVQSLLKEKQQLKYNQKTQFLKNGQQGEKNRQKQEQFSQTFDKIRLSMNQQSQKQKKKSQGKGKMEQNIKAYCSEPNSFDISFQAPPSFKSLQDLPCFIKKSSIKN